MDEHRIALRGLLVRHLVLPNDLAGTRETLRWLAEEISPNTYLNLMDQYRPCYKANEYPELNHRITREEYQRAVQWAEELGLTRLDERVPLRVSGL
jgi:putative pyruvate formate lyase activating enzyme